MTLELMKKLITASEKEIFLFLKNYLSKYYKRVEYKYKEYIIAEGTVPVALVAHLDTVFEKKESTQTYIEYRHQMDFFYDQEQKVLWSPDGAGFDDRAGVYAIIRIIESGLRPSVIFTCGEETGGIGASALIERYPKSPFKNLKFLIELDRMGENDCVFYNCDNKEFVEYIEGFGFKEDLGSFTDISILAPQWKVAAVNLSVGYLDEHSYVERLYIDWLEATINKVRVILSQKKIPKFKYIPFVYKKGVCSLCGAKIPRPIYQGGLKYDICLACANQYLLS